jgi:hypothetical protein
MMMVDVDPGPEPRISTPRPLFKRKRLGWSVPYNAPPGFDVAPDEQRFVLAVPVSDRVDQDGIVVLENWLGEFARQ